MRVEEVRPRRTRIRRRLGIAALLVGLAVALVASVGSGRDAEAADLGRFQPGDIISDAFFFDGWAMSADEVQTFLDQKGASCKTGADGTPCLRVYRQDTPYRAADDRCAAYAGAPQETAAAIIAKVGQACGISPRVIMVMLQKEQALVTNSGATLKASRYRSAMGYGCPDTAPCDSLYYGFFNQVYNAAHQFKNYAAKPANYGYRAGRVNQVRYSPDAACGSSPVFILNQATAGLYNYTPYQPNAAALRAGYGTGDDCSAYGNRNFYSYFVDWFGSTHDAGATQISVAYYRMGPGSIGAPLAEPICGLVAGGCLQHFQQASIYWSPASGAHVLRGGIRGTWGESGWEMGVLGYPVGEETATADGVGRSQQFQGGVIFWSPTTGAQPVRGGMLGTWAGLGADTGLFGYPTSGELPTADGVGRKQTFQGGTIFWSASTGAQPVRGGMFGTYAGLGADAGILGYPTSGELPTADGVGRKQTFQGGTIFWSAATGAQPVRGGMLVTYARLGAAAGDLGYPVGPEQAAAGGTSAAQEFQGGTVYWSPVAGSHAVLDALAGGFSSRGGVTGFLGLPVGDQRRLSGGAISQDFQGGVLYLLPSAETVAVHGGVLASYQRAGGDAGALGLPTTDEQTVGSAQVQQFSSGSIYWTAAGGAHPVRGGVGYAWLDTGGLSGPLGAPVGDEVDAGPGRSQAFVNGTVYWSVATGGRAVSVPLRDAYVAAGGPAGPLGFPAQDEKASGSARVQQFQSGSIYWTAAGGAHPVRGGIGGAWSAAGGLTGALGAPTSDEEALGGGAVQRFTGGALYWGSAAVARRMGNDVLAAWISAGGPTGRLGEPTGDQYVRDGAGQVDFQGGRIVVRSGAAPEVVFG